MHIGLKEREKKLPNAQQTKGIEHKSTNNKTVPNKYKEKTTNLPTEKLQIYQPKNYKSTKKKLQISQQRTANLTTIQRFKIKPSTAQYCPFVLF